MFRHWQSDFRGSATGLVLALAVWSSAVQAAIAQVRVTGTRTPCRPASSIAPAEALGLVVGLKTYVDSGFFQNGSGIVIGDGGGMLYVATAAHVVLDAGAPVDSIHAYFYSTCDRPVPARLCSLVDPKRDLDLAVLCIPASAAASGRYLGYTRRGDVRRLGARTPVYPVGCPGGECWGIGQPDKVLLAGSSAPRILFTTFFVAPGHSGGALFNQWWEVVGMVTKLGRPLSEAIPIDSVLSAACDTGCGRRDRKLEEPFVPRGGYRLSAGLQGLFSASDGEPGGRFPPGRANLMYRLIPLLEIHAGSIRLTPENLSITGGMAGLGLTIPATGRVMVNPFLEGGFARVEGRFDAGGHYIDDNGTNRYVPLWRQVKDDGLGFGAGVSLQAVVMPRTIVEVTVGHWSFNLPVGAPEGDLKTPDVSWGAGLRFGI